MTATNPLSLPVDGIWWLPDESGTKWPGRLIEENNNFQLTTFEDEDPARYFAQSYDVIHGHGYDGRIYSLLDCHERGRTTTRFGLQTRAYWVREVLCGCHSGPVQSPPLAVSATQDASALKAWLGHDGLDARLLDGLNRFRIEYRRPAPLTLNLPNDLCVSFRWSPPPVLPPPWTEATDLRTSVWVEFVPPAPQPLSYFERCARMIQGFTTLVTRLVFAHTWIGARLHDNDESDDYVTLHRNKKYPYMRPADPPGVMDLTFTSEHLGDRLEEGLGAWFSSQDRLLLILDLFIAATAGQGFIEHRFLTVAQALEIFHRRFRPPGLLVPKGRYEMYIAPALKNSVPRDIGRDARDALTHRFRYLNEFSLKRRIRELVREYEDAMKEVFGDVRRLPKLIGDARDKLVHGTDDSYSREPGTAERLYSYSETGRVLLEFCLLGLLGLSPEEIRDLARSRPAYQRLVGVFQE